MAKQIELIAAIAMIALLPAVCAEDSYRRHYNSSETLDFRHDFEFHGSYMSNKSVNNDSLNVSGNLTARNESAIPANSYENEPAESGANVTIGHGIEKETAPEASRAERKEATAIERPKAVVAPKPSANASRNAEWIAIKLQNYSEKNETPEVSIHEPPKAEENILGRLFNWLGRVGLRH
jgi:hypothetical protein